MSVKTENFERHVKPCEVVRGSGSVLHAQPHHPGPHQVLRLGRVVRRRFDRRGLRPCVLDSIPVLLRAERTPARNREGPKVAFLPTFLNLNSTKSAF